MNEKGEIILNLDCNYVESSLSLLKMREERLKSAPLYDVLLMELYEEGCSKSAYHLEKLVQEEANLIAAKQIKKPLCDDRHILLIIVDSLKLIEIKRRSKTREDLLQAMGMMVQVINTVEGFGNEHHWILPEMYDALNVCVMSIDPKIEYFHEFKARFFYKYGEFMRKKGGRSAYCLRILQWALKLSRGKNHWKTNIFLPESEHATLYEAVAELMAKACMTFTQQYYVSLPKQCIQACDDAICVFRKDGANKNIVLVSQCKILKIKTFIKWRVYDEALLLISELEKSIATHTSYDLVLIQCKNYRFLAICYYYMAKFKKAVTAYQQSLNIAMMFNLMDSIGRIYMEMGRCYLKIDDCNNMAMSAFMAAKDHFAEYLNEELFNECEKLIKELEKKDCSSPERKPQWRTFSATSVIETTQSATAQTQTHIQQQAQTESQQQQSLQESQQQARKEPPPRTSIKLYEDDVLANNLSAEQLTDNAEDEHSSSKSETPVEEEYPALGQELRKNKKKKKGNKEPEKNRKQEKKKPQQPIKKSQKKESQQQKRGFKIKKGKKYPKEK